MNKRLRALAARIRRPRHTNNRPAAAKFNEPPIFPTDALLPPSAELAVPADARPYPYSLATPTCRTRPATVEVLRPMHPESPYHFADATLHIGDTAVPAKVTTMEVVWDLNPPKHAPDRTILGIDGDIIIKATISEDGTVTTVIPAVDDEPPPPPAPSAPSAPPRRRGGPPNNCPCTAICSECRCPVRP